MLSCDKVDHQEEVEDLLASQDHETMSHGQGVSEPPISE